MADFLGFLLDCFAMRPRSSDSPEKRRQNGCVWIAIAIVLGVFLLVVTALVAVGLFL